MSAAKHAFRVTRPYPAAFAWHCLCGHLIVQPFDETAADAHARLLAHVNGEDGLQLCQTGCGLLTGKCAQCPAVTR